VGEVSWPFQRCSSEQAFRAFVTPIGFNFFLLAVISRPAIAVAQTILHVAAGFLFNK
jgi:hypothetical protein